MVVVPARGRGGRTALFGKFPLETPADVGIFLGNEVSVFSIDFNTVAFVQLAKAFYVNPVGDEGAIWSRSIHIHLHALLRVTVCACITGT